jgi:hypothetical protein
MNARRVFHIPRALVDLALNVRSPDGRSYAERLRQAKTERALSDMFEDFIGSVPLGRRLFGDLNPVRTVGRCRWASRSRSRR